MDAVKINIVGQEDLLKNLRRVFEVFIASNGLIKPHFFLTGGSGSGKSVTIKALVDEMELKFLTINAAQLTKEGTSGNSLSKALAPLMQMGGKKTVVFVDEFDKMFISGNDNCSLAHETTAGVQNEFLKVLESSEASVYSDYGKYATISVKNVLFIFAGAFNSEPDITLDRLQDLGIKTEFLGRVGLVYNTVSLTLDNLFQILEESPLLATYLLLFKDADRAKIVAELREYIEANYEINTLGARFVNTTIHQRFINGPLGKAPKLQPIMTRSMSLEQKA